MSTKHYSCEDLSKVTKQNILLYNKEIASIPARIDEVRRGIPEAMNWDSLEARKLELEQELSALERHLMSTQMIAADFRSSQDMIMSLRQQIDAKKQTLARKANEHVFSRLNDLAKRRWHVNSLNDELDELEERQRKLEALIHDSKPIIESARQSYLSEIKQQGKLRTEKWPGLDASDGVCKHCGQPLRPDMLAQIEADALVSFTRKQKSLLTKSISQANDAVAKGKGYKNYLEKYQLDLQSVLDQIDQCQKDLDLEEQTIMEIEADPAAEYDIDDFVDDPEVSELADRLKNLEGSIMHPDDDSTRLLSGKAKIVAELQEIDQVLASRHQVALAEKRISELTNRNRELGDLISEQEGIKFSLEKMIQRKAEMLEESINNRFKYVKFRLFRQNINGGIEDDCEPLINGVPYTTGASTSERIRAGLDITRAMQEAASIQAPIFVDNAESATWLLDLDCQMIQLIVSAADKTLRIEVEEQNGYPVEGKTADYSQAIPGKVDDRFARRSAAKDSVWISVPEELCSAECDRERNLVSIAGS